MYSDHKIRNVPCSKKKRIRIHADNIAYYYGGSRVKQPRCARLIIIILKVQDGGGANLRTRHAHFQSFYLKVRFFYGSIGYTIADTVMRLSEDETQRCFLIKFRLVGSRDTCGSKIETF